MAWLFYRTETDPVSPDGIFVKSGVSFRLYDGAGDTQPVGPVREGPKYITLQIWQDLYPELIAPGSIIVPGNEGDLRNYSIVLGIEPKIKSIDLRPKTNLSAHHTDLYQVEDASRFILRRGQPFDVTVQFEAGGINTTCDEFLFVAEHEFDAEPVMIQIPITTELPEEGWGAKLLGEPQVDAEGRRTYQVRLTTPHDAPVGEWTFGAAVKRDGTEVPAVIKNFPAAVLLLFNPWNEADDVYMASEVEREEYVLNRVTRFRLGSEANQELFTWVLSQHEWRTLGTALSLMNGLSSSQRSNAATILARLAPMMNAQPPKPDGVGPGLVEGRWSDYHNPFDSATPHKWRSTAAVLQEYADREQPVQYGQCWVFAAMLASLSRSCGIPARVVTITQCGLDRNADELLTLVYEWNFLTRRAEFNENAGDMLWNFHVWTEAWMDRSDRSGTFQNRAWQAIDATNQAPSEETGYFAFGPAPVHAIRGAGGDTSYDVPRFRTSLRGPQSVEVRDGGTVQQGAERPLARTVTTWNGSSSISLRDEYVPPPLPPNPPLEVLVSFESASSLDDSIIVHLEVVNHTPDALQVHVDAQCAPHQHRIPSGMPPAERFSTLLTSGASHDFTRVFLPAEYHPWLVGWEGIFVSAVVSADGTEHLAHDMVWGVFPQLPGVTLTSSREAELLVGQAVDFEVSFTNTSARQIDNAILVVSGGDGIRFGGQVGQEFSLGSLLPGQAVTRTVIGVARSRGAEVVSAILLNSTTPVEASNLEFFIAPCVADWNEDEVVDALDFFAFLDIFTLLDESADLTGASDPMDPAYGQPNGIVDTDDFFYFLDIFVIGCS